MKGRKRKVVSDQCSVESSFMTLMSLQSLNWLAQEKMRRGEEEGQMAGSRNLKVESSIM